MKVDSTQEILLEAKDLKQDESFLRKVERSGKTLVYSLFKEADNQDAIDLDKKSTMFSMLGGLIKAGRNFSDRYEEKLLKYKEGFIIVCRCVGDPVEAGEKKKAKEHDQSNKGFLCGKTNVAMKEIYFNGKLVKAGYIFDLRVDDEYQRLKIASDIVDLAKERLTKEGCEIFYSYTNYNNIKSMAFHERNGFKISSSRALFSHMYSKGAFSPVEETTVVEGKTVKFERSDSASGRMKTDKYYKEKQEDLYLKDFSEIQALEGN
jgi:ribosomal protein S18 acetylase RimI-like enzyme